MISKNNIATPTTLPPIYVHSELDNAFKQIQKMKTGQSTTITRSNTTPTWINLRPLDETSPLLYRYIRYYSKGVTQGNGGLSYGVIINYTKKTMQVYPVICSRYDTFNKKTARDLIEVRVSDKLFIEVIYDDAFSIEGNLYRALRGSRKSFSVQWGYARKDIVYTFKNVVRSFVSEITALPMFDDPL